MHGRYREPCPVCGAPVQRIRYADNETNYCARCQTGGRLLADRAMSRLLHEDWPGRSTRWSAASAPETIARPRSVRLVRWRVCALMTIGSFVAYLLRSNMSVAGVPMAADLGLSHISSAWCSGRSPGATRCSSFPAAWWAT